MAARAACRGGAGMTDPTRPALRWHGGKWRLAPWVISHFPPHRIYVEPFGGGASVLIRKPRSYSEVYNDLDQEAVNFFRVLRGPRAGELVSAIALTPFSRTEFVECYQPTDDDVERARRLVVRSFMGFGSDGHNIAVRTGFRATGHRAHTTPAHDWANYPEALKLTVARLRGVVIECKPALDVIEQQDNAQTLFYVDPPYLPETRSNKSRKSGEKYHAYSHELVEADHVELLARLKSAKGMIVLSGYPAPLYDDALKDWTRVEKAALADGAKARTEVLWINPAAVRAGELFGAVA